MYAAWTACMTDMRAIRRTSGNGTAYKMILNPSRAFPDQKFSGLSTSSRHQTLKGLPWEHGRFARLCGRGLHSQGPAP